MIDFRRPLSPHLQIYKPQLTSVLSITHRMSGMVLGKGAGLLTIWLLLVAFAPMTADWILSYQETWVFRLVVAVFVWALMYHGLNGVRHLFWDWGRGFELRTAMLTGWLVLLTSFAATAWVML